MKFCRIIFFIPLLYYGLTGECQTSKADTIKMLCQTWKFKSISHEPISEELLEDWKYWKTNTQFTFFTNKRYKEVLDDEVNEGEWEYDSIKKLITLKEVDSSFWYLKTISQSKLEVEFLTIMDSQKMINAILIPVKN